jgi:signal-transduction protein with cAMP-binding, CBS, and nucleotidyltransferase domain
MKAVRDQKLTALAELPLFADLGQHELVELAKALDMSWASPGETLEMEDRQTRWWKVIVHGTACVSQHGEPTGLLNAGHWWGERSIVSGERSMVTVVAVTPVVLLTLGRRDFLELPRRHPLVASRIIMQLVDRRAPYEGWDVA